MVVDEKFEDLSDFLGEYASHLMGCGVHTSRVVRNTKRIGRAFGVEVVVSLFQRTFTISLYDNKHKRLISKLVEIDHGPILFLDNSELSAFSWEVLDKKLTFSQMEKRYKEIINMKKLNPWVIVFLASLANMSFCALFGGDFISMIIVFVCTFAGFRLRQLMTRWKCNSYLTVVTSAFVAALIASCSRFFDTTNEIAMITSVLYLIPGVPLVNGIIDIIEGYTLMGLTRLINCFLLVLCISIGLGAVLLLFNGNLL